MIFHYSEEVKSIKMMNQLNENREEILVLCQTSRKSLKKQPEKLELNQSRLGLKNCETNRKFNNLCLILTTIIPLLIAHLITVSTGKSYPAKKTSLEEQEAKIIINGRALGSSQFEPGQSFAYSANPQNGNKESQFRNLLKIYPSEKNLRLFKQLNRNKLDYFLLYPEAAGRAGSASGGSGLEKRDISIIQQQQQQQQPLTAWRLTQDQANSVLNSKSNLVSGANSSKSNQVLGHYSRTNVVIKAFNHKFRLDLELNNNLFGPGLIQKHFLPKGNQQISSQKIEHCYYHGRTQSDSKSFAIGAFRTCNGLSGIIHVNQESFVIHPFYDADQSKKHPHIIYRYQTASGSQLADSSQGQPMEQSESSSATVRRRECGNTRLHEWALRQYSKFSPTSGWDARFARDDNEQDSAGQEVGAESKKCLAGGDCDRGKLEPRKEKKSRFSKRDVSLTEKFIEFALVLNQDMFDKRNSSSRLEVVHDSIQIVNCLDLYFKFINTRISLIYLETWQHGNQIEISNNVKQTLYNFLEYSKRKLYKVSYDAIHLLTGGFNQQFEQNEIGMSIPDSICTSKAVSVSQEASLFEPFITASTMAHMLGHNLGMEHDEALLPSPTGSGPNVSQAESRAGLGSLAPPAANPGPSSGPSKPRVHGASKHHQLSAKHKPLHNRPPSSGGSNGNNNNGLDSEDHEDEIKSRSISSGSERFSNMDEASTTQTDSDGDNSHVLCRSNCLMSERLTYVQPPVTIGNMIEQSVGTGSGGSESGEQFSINTTLVSPGQELLNGQAIERFDGEQQQVPQTGSMKQQQQFNGLPFRFSKNSIDTYHRLLRLGRGICLFNKPNQLEDFNSCGNGIVDKGEDCDCGSIQECLEQDSCCDPITCHFKADAECIMGACCDRCSLRRKGFVCRRARNECDLPELCDGKSGQCGPDVYKQNGAPCLNSSAYCFMGQCPNHDAQCNELWGSDARSSSEQCYVQFNLNGTIRGNCGFQSSQQRVNSNQNQNQNQKGPAGGGPFRRCEPESIMCGTLQCQLGDMKPVTAALVAASLNSSTSGGQAAPSVAANAEFSKKILHTFDGSQHHECKVIIAQANSSPAIVGSSYVRDGSKCGNNKVCFNQTCQPIESVYRDSFELCPRDERGVHCSGNGLCSSANKCHCNQDWLGHDCSQRETSLTHHRQLAQENSPIVTSLIEPQTEAILTEARNGNQQPASTSSVLVDLGPPTTSAEVAAQTSQAGQPTEQATTQATAPQEATKAAAPEPAAASPPPPQAAGHSNGKGSQVNTAPTSSTVVVDKKKHDALGAPTLVFILVSIVAAVYVGFALMANCYRRKGFLKPDKVLRHHQMNCKLDAIRSSFIAKRLADAEVVLQNGPSVLDSSAMVLDAPQSAAGPLEMPFSGPQSVANCQHLQPAALNPMCCPESSRYLNDQGPSGAQFAAAGRGQQQQSQQQFAAVHYYRDENQPNVSLMEAAINLGANLNESAAEFGDHVPLLDGQAHQHRQHHHHHHHHHKHHLQQPMLMRSFKNLPVQNLVELERGNQRQKQQQVIYSEQQQLNQRNLANNRGSFGTTGRDGSQMRSFTNINRATSLGNVNKLAQFQQQQQQQVAMSEAEELMGTSESRRIHRALATPSRLSRTSLVRNGYGFPTQMGPRPHNQFDLDSCSAPSSPEHRDPCWSDAERRLKLAHGGQASNYNSIGRQQSSHSLLMMQQANPSLASGNYHEDVLLFEEPRKRISSLSSRRQHSVEQTAEGCVPGEAAGGSRLPSPPPPPSLGNRASSEEEDSSEPMTVASNIQSTGARAKVAAVGVSRPNCSPSRNLLSSWNLMRSVKRTGLNDVEQPKLTDKPRETKAELSLIAQLQQLERVQRMHQRELDGQAVGEQSRPILVNSEAGLHEFFSLPLSIQLSALLARSLNQSSANSPPIQAPLDDYLNTLNNSSVASSSRRSFKSKQQSAPTDPASNSQSRASTLNRNKFKLENLQSLIDKLQQLHNQTALQQQLKQFEAENNSDADEENSVENNKLPARRSNQINARKKQSVDDSNQAINRRGIRYSQTTRIIKAEDATQNQGQAESIYSMSDSEDGGGPRYVSGVIKAYQRHQSVDPEGGGGDTGLDSNSKPAEKEPNFEAVPSPPPPLNETNCNEENYLSNESTIPSETQI